MIRQHAGNRLAVARLEEHPNLTEVLGVLARLPHIADDDLPRLAALWCNGPSLSEARSKALAPDSPLVVEVLGAFDALTALFADDLLGEASYLTVDVAVTARALKAVRDAIAAAYARPVLRRSEYTALMRPWWGVYPKATIDEPDLGPRAEQVKMLLAALPDLSGRCHDAGGRALFEALVDQSFVAESERAEAAASALTAVVLTGRRRVWTLVRRTGTAELGQPCRQCRTSAPHDEREAQRVLDLCLDAACALLVADALPDAATDLLTWPVFSVISLQREAYPSRRAGRPPPRR